MDRIKPWIPWLVGLGLVLSIALVLLGGNDTTADPTPTTAAAVAVTASPITATETETTATEVAVVPTEPSATAEPEQPTATPAPPTATATAEPPTLTPTATPDAVLFEESGVALEYPLELAISNVRLDRVPAQLLGADGPTFYFTDVPEFLRLTLDTPQGPAELLIRPIRNAEGAFFSTQPTTLQTYFTDFETQIAAEDPARPDQQQAAYLDFGSDGRGLRAISYLLTEPGPAKITNERLYYFFDGFSTDGRYYVSLTYPISAPGLEESGEFTDEELAQVTADFDTYAAETLAPLADLAPTDFGPDLALLDELVQSIAIAPEASTAVSIYANDPDCVNDATYVRDVTIQDAELINISESFTKIWEVLNTGTCTWNPAYTATFIDGADLGWKGFVPVERVAPGETFQIAVDLQGPDAPGIYEGRWQMIDNNGQPFGVLVYVTIVVPETPVVRTPTATPLVPPTATPESVAGPTATPRPPVTPEVKSCVDNLAFVNDITIPDGTAVDPDQRFAKTWEVSGAADSGTPCAWASTYSLTFIDGNPMGWDGNMLLTRVDQATNIYQISVNLIAPTTPGVYQARWQMTNEFGQPFGQIIYLAIVVPDLP